MTDRLLLLFCGYDRNESAGWHVFAQTAMEAAERARIDLALVPVGSEAGRRDGSTAFAYDRFHCAELAGREGWAMFCDGADMMIRTNAELEELLSFRDERFAAMVVKHDYRTRHPRKFIGTPMETANRDYPRKNWSSVILWNCGHPANRRLTTEMIRRSSGEYLHRFGWLRDEEIGSLPQEWNWLADEHGENPAAKILHWTAGNPGFDHYRSAPHAAEWWSAFHRAVAQEGDHP